MPPRRDTSGLVNAEDLVSETEHQRSFCDAVEKLGWDAYHTPDPRRATARGFPDVVFKNEIHPPHIIVIEFKKKGGRTRKEQPGWIASFTKAGIPAMVAEMPRDWDAALALFTGAFNGR